MVVDPRDGSMGTALDGLDPGGKKLIVLLPQLGDFSAEYVEQLVAVAGDLAAAGVSLRVIGIGCADAGLRFERFIGLQAGVLRVDPSAAVHRALGLYEGPGWQAPNVLPDDIRAGTEAWVNYSAMCAGIASPGTLQEILRGYLGDRSAPERLKSNSRVEAGPLRINGTRSFQVGPLAFDLWWAGEKGFQRPVELATVRLRNLVEVLSNWSTYVPDPAYLAQRGGTFLFDGSGETLYEFRDPGVLVYSATMSRPLSFLKDYIGDRALNPLGLGDPGPSH